MFAPGPNPEMATPAAGAPEGSNTVPVIVTIPAATPPLFEIAEIEMGLPLPRRMTTLVSPPTASPRPVAPCSLALTLTGPPQTLTVKCPVASVGVLVPGCPVPIMETHAPLAGCPSALKTCPASLRLAGLNTTAGRTRREVRDSSSVIVICRTDP